METYLRNCWYMAAWSHEIEDKPLGRTLLDEPIVLFRDESGSVAAMQDRCPHRLVPLSRGQVVNGALECTYHGLRFDGAGRCVFNPQGDVPKIKAIDTFPIVERDRMVWIWMGDRGCADPSLIPDYAVYGEDGGHFAGDHIVMQCNYQFAVDNLLDLTHIDFLHRKFLATIFSKPEREIGVVDQRGDTIWSQRLYYGVKPQFPVPLADGSPPDTLFDRWQDVRWDMPSNLLLVSGIVPQGTCDMTVDALSRIVKQIRHAHILTPQTATTSHYFYGAAYPASVGAAGAKWVELEHKGTAEVFTHEDAPMLAAQQKAFGDNEFWSMRPLILEGDAAAIRARRLLAKRIREESREPTGAQVENRMA